MKERTIQNAILVALSTAFAGEAIWWKNDTGTAKSMDGKRTIRFGLKGSPDILGCYGGRFFGIEVKTATGSQEDSQKKFQKVFERSGGIYIIARSPEEAVREIRKRVALLDA